MPDDRPPSIADLLAGVFDQLTEDLPEPSPDAKPIKVCKHAAYVPVSDWDLMDAGVIPDTRPPAPKPTRRQRLRTWRREKTTKARRRIGLWIAGIDPSELDDREDW